VTSLKRNSATFQIARVFCCVLKWQRKNRGFYVASAFDAKAALSLGRHHIKWKNGQHFVLAVLPLRVIDGCLISAVERYPKTC